MESGEGRRRLPRGIALALLLAAVQTVLLVRTAWDKSDTIDEGSAYIPRSSWLFQQEGNALPPLWLLPQWAFAAALHAEDPRGVLWPEPARPWPPTGPGPDRLQRLLLAVRAPTIFVTVMGGLLLWDAARRQGAGAGLLAHALWCFSPAVLAHGCLVTLDGWLGAISCAVVWATVRLEERPSLARVAGAALPLALAITTKLTSVLLLPVFGVVGGMVILRAARAGGRPGGVDLLRATGVFLATLFVAVWAIYRFTTGHLDQNLLAEFGAGPFDPGPLPFPRFVEGVITQLTFGAKGHQAYLFGHVRHQGWWWFYLAVVALQTTIGAQALALLASAAWLRLRRPQVLRVAALLAYPALLFAVLSLGSAQSGIRYLLPAFPPVILALASAAGDVPRAFGRAGTALLAGCVVAATSESLAVHPHSLMFFNAWAGGPEGGPRYLIHSNDWGQDQRRLGEWQAANGLPWIYYTPYSGNPEAWGIHYEDVSCTPKKGIFALQAVEVHRPRRIDEGCLDWLTAEPPDQRLGWSIYIYVVDKARLARLRHPEGPPFWRSALP